MRRVRIACAQLNVVVGDLDGNAERIAEWIQAAETDGCDLVAFPELALTGYPPEDLLLKPGFVEDNLEALHRIVRRVGRCAAVIGFVDRDPEGLYNAVAVCAGGRIRGVYRKRRLPNYAVFDEQRYFEEGREPLQLYEIGGVRVGVSICEDAWAPGGPIAQLSRGGAELIVNVNGSPYHAGKVRQREEMLAARADEADCPIVYVNMVGGQDELVFDGASFVVTNDGDVVTRAGQYTEELFITDLEVPSRPWSEAALPIEMVTRESAATGPVLVAVPAEPLERWAEVYGALVAGTRDYVRKNGFREVVLGLSGGIDSSLVAAVAVDALGADRVHGVLMPSRYSSAHSISDAEQLCANLGIEHRTIVIEPAFEAFLQMLAPSFGERPADTTEENIQPRIRGTLLMALSNKFGWLVLTTGNKSEMAVGYATLYGDMAGGFAVIKDVPKTWVFELCRDLNRRAGREIIPQTVIDKPPSAELRPDQLDTDSLPPYDQLDPILEAYIEHDRTAGELIELGFDPQLVRRVVRLVDLAEYKRRQAPPGVRVTTKAFGKDRRLPITNGYRG
ncbi:NAD+ synthase [Rhabdothermincola sediminis]|uniref:NAD+ synthase n=1 Tax=Rhabdothermincola sediminis TaxID=2751370 RepID=UPI001AA04280|nr:NAD+ synthase [Rhabdothermincola sediminis]